MLVLDERIISCQIKIIGLISCKKYIGKFLIVENLKNVIMVRLVKLDKLYELHQVSYDSNIILVKVGKFG